PTVIEHTALERGALGRILNKVCDVEIQCDGAADQMHLDVVTIRKQALDGAKQHRHILVAVEPGDLDEANPPSFACVLAFWDVPAAHRALGGQVHIPRVTPIHGHGFLAVKEGNIRAQHREAFVPAQNNAKSPAEAALKRIWAEYVPIGARDISRNSHN